MVRLCPNCSVSGPWGVRRINGHYPSRPLGAKRRGSDRSASVTRRSAGRAGSAAILVSFASGSASTAAS